jgi:DNA-binding transcriptional ArsR family regulator
MGTTGRHPVDQTATGQSPTAEPPLIREVAATLKIISEPVRLQLLSLLAEGERTATELSESLGLGHPATSRHLALLRVHRIISPRRRARQNYYALTELGELLIGWVGRLMPMVPEPGGLGEPPVPMGVAELVFESTKDFEDDIWRIPHPTRLRVADEINDRCRIILEDRRAIDESLSRPFRPPLPDGLESTLSVMELEGGYRVILAVDDDPLFGRVLVSLLRIVEGQDAAAAYRSAASMLYDGL